MRRVVVLVGVSRVPGLPPLQGVAAGLAAMGRWAAGQQDTQVVTHSDLDGTPVTVAALLGTVTEIATGAPTDQLVVYFAGHGVNIGRSEHWLLSGVPQLPGEAVSVDKTEVFARTCGIPHVVLLSDACRTAARDVVWQSITGNSIAPNLPTIGQDGHIDRFYACALGDPAYEARIPDVGWTAVYTEVLAEALGGRWPEALEWAAAEPSVGLVRPWPLEDVLESRVGRRLAASTSDITLSQRPSAIITSRGTEWVSRLPGHTSEPTALEPTALIPAGPPPAGPPPAGPPPAGPPPAGPAVPPLDGLPDLLGRTLDEQLRDPAATLPSMLDDPARRGDVTARTLLDVVSLVRIASQETRHYPYDVAHMSAIGESADLLQLPGHTMLVVPRIPGHRESPALSRDDLLDVAYIPVDGPGDPVEAATLRGLVVAGMRFGALRLDHDRAERLADVMQAGDRLDVSLTLYAAYAFHDLARPELLAPLADRLAGETGVELFDVAMLAGRRASKDPTVPSIPLMARGWALADVLDVDLPPDAQRLRAALLPSLFTRFPIDDTTLEAVLRLP